MAGGVKMCGHSVLLLCLHNYIRGGGVHGPWSGKAKHPYTAIKKVLDSRIAKICVTTTYYFPASCLSSLDRFWRSAERALRHV